MATAIGYWGQILALNRNTINTRSIRSVGSTGIPQHKTAHYHNLYWLAVCAYRENRKPSIVKKVAIANRIEDYTSSNATFEPGDMQASEWIRQLILLRSVSTCGAAMSCRASSFNKSFQKKREASHEESLNIEITVGILIGPSYNHYGLSSSKLFYTPQTKRRLWELLSRR